MSRSGYVEDFDDQWATIRWRGAVKSAIRGKRGQAFLREMQASLEAMPEKRLIAGDLQAPTGEVCALGSVGISRKMDMSDIDPYDSEGVASQFGISFALACEIVYENDEAGLLTETPEHRYNRVLKWVNNNLST